MINKNGGTIAVSWSILLIGCFIFALFIFIGRFQSDNPSVVLASNDPNLQQSLTIVNGTLTTYYSDSNTTVTGIYGSSIEPGSDILSRPSTFTTPSEGALPDYANVSKSALKNLFGGDGNIWVIAGAFIGFATVVIGLYVWKTLKGGAPD